MSWTQEKTDGLDVWMAAHVPGYVGPLRVEQLAGGQSNPTFRLTTPEHAYVLRRKPSGPVLPSAHAVDREFRVMQALAGSDVPVPPVLALCDDPSVVGSMFYVMGFVPGRVVHDPRMPGFSPADRALVFDDLNRVMAALHRIDPAEVGLGDYGRPGAYAARQIARWTKQYRASQIHPIPAMESLIEWLPRHAPEGNETRLVHGDYRLDNVILHPTEPRILAVLDWELSTLGCPLTDFANHMMTWHVAPDLFRGLAGEDLGALGIPLETEYRARWLARTGHPEPENWNFYLALALFRMAAILQGIARRALDGTAADADAKAVGAKAAPMAELGWHIAQSS
ncbi:MAG: phosphotransferase family protein [Gemmobacter sp.]|nr:phosphotransferase family protein [Gemmobacter sp.]